MTSSIIFFQLICSVINPWLKWWIKVPSVFFTLKPSSPTTLKKKKKKILPHSSKNIITRPPNFYSTSPISLPFLLSYQFIHQIKLKALPEFFCQTISLLFSSVTNSSIKSNSKPYLNSSAKPQRLTFFSKCC